MIQTFRWDELGLLPYDYVLYIILDGNGMVVSQVWEMNWSCKKTMERYPVLLLLVPRATPGPWFCTRLSGSQWQFLAPCQGREPDTELREDWDQSGHPLGQRVWRGIWIKSAAGGDESFQPQYVALASMLRGFWKEGYRRKGYLKEEGDLNYRHLKVRWKPACLTKLMLTEARILTQYWERQRSLKGLRQNEW